MKNLITILVLVTFSLPLMSIFGVKPETDTPKPSNAERMYESIICYADSFNIPLYFAFNIATLETSYLGPLHHNYNHSQVSKAGALGPMQIMHKYASYFAGRKVTKTELKDSIEFNVQLSMKIISEHYQKYGDWAKVAGAYNTGRPIINSYAKKASDPNYYLSRWILND